MQETQQGYFPAIDGLRAFAVLAVLFFHAGHLSGGFLGVDAFFVISGFLITGLLLREADRTGGVALGAFWARRARRLLPALALMVCVVTLWNLRFGTASERLALHGDTLWSLSFLMNWHEVAADHDYWSAFALQSPLTHLWSLAVEEQFYLVWPLIALAVVRWARRPQRAMFALCAVGAIASFGLMAMLYDPASSTRVYEGTDTRIGAMLIGGLCATQVVRTGVTRLLAPTSRARGWCVTVALVAASGTALWMYARERGNDPVLFRGGFFVFAIAIGIVIAAVTVTPEQHHPRALTRLVSVLALRPLRSIGRLSYGLYLWHWPIFLVLSPAFTGMGEWQLLALRLAVTGLVATLSYYVVEQPVRMGLARRPPWMSAPATALAVGAAALLSVSVALPQSAATAINVQGLASLSAGLHSVVSVADSTSAPKFAGLSSSLDGGAVVAQEPPVAPTTTTVVKRGSVSTVVLFGDSIAYTTVPALDAAYQAAGVTLIPAAGPGVGLINQSAYYDILNQLSPTIDQSALLIVVQLSVWDAKYGEEAEYQALTLLHQAVAERHAHLAFMSPPPLRADQDKGGISGLRSAAQRVARDWPADVLYLDASAVWGQQYQADLNGDHVPERMYDGVHMCPSGAALVSAWLVASTAQYFDGVRDTPLAEWAGGPWTNNPIYSSPPGTCAAV